MDHVTVETRPNDDGSYVVELHLSDDLSQTLTAELAVAHARYVLGAASTARHDAAVVRQLRSIGLDDTTAIGLVVTAMREARSELDAPTPLKLVPGVSAFDGRPFLLVMVAGLDAGQWDCDAAEHHAMACLQALDFARLDAAYLIQLRRLGIDEARALQVIGDLGHHLDAPE